MKKVLQEIVCQGKGDCARAAMASLFDKELDEMPKFYPDSKQSLNIFNYFIEQGYDPSCYNRQKSTKKTKYKYPSFEEVIKYDGGINGYFYASVPSQTFKDCSHAVIVDINLNIVHDPNPNQLALKLLPEDVSDVIVVGDWHISVEGEILKNK